MSLLKKPRKSNLRMNEVDLIDAQWINLACSMYETFPLTEPTLSIDFTNAVFLSGIKCFNLSICIVITIFQLTKLRLTNWITNLWNLYSNSCHNPAIYVFPTMSLLKKPRIGNLRINEVSLIDAQWINLACSMCETFPLTEPTLSIHFTYAVFLSGIKCLNLSICIVITILQLTEL